MIWWWEAAGQGRWAGGEESVIWAGKGLEEGNEGDKQVEEE